MSLLATIDEHLKDAMRARESDLVGTLRLIKSELKRVAIDAGKDELSEDAELDVLRRMGKQRRDSIEQFRSGSRNDLADKEEAELCVIEKYLPQAITSEQLDEIITNAIGGAVDIDPKQMGALVGKVMGAVKATGLSYDGKAVNERVRARLSGG